MSNDINISGSSLRGTFAIGANANAINQGNQTIQDQNCANAFDTLSRHLAEHGMAAADISALHDALTADQSSPAIAQKKIGPAVKTWMQRMFGKAIDTSWQIEVGIVGSLLASSIQRYYGWS